MKQRPEINKENLECLPEWFAYPRPLMTWQSSLFKIKLEDALVRLKISKDDLDRWYNKDWISFEPSKDMEIDEFEGPHIFELTFVRDIVRYGLADAQIDYLLGLLPTPFTFDPVKISFSFMYGWVETIPAKAPEEVIVENLDSWLEDLAQSDDSERLRELGCRIEELLEEM